MTLPSIRPLIYLITSGEATQENFDRSSADVMGLIRDAAHSGIPLVQLRERSLSARSIFDLTVMAVDACRGSETKVLVNGRMDIAMAAGADGVHLPGNGLPVDVVRKNSPAGFIVGSSCHSPAEVVAARNQGADFAVFGPVYSTPGKGEPVGPDVLAETVKAAGSFPVLALGGIDSGNYRSVLETGAAGFSAIRFLNDRDTLVHLGREFYAR